MRSERYRTLLPIDRLRESLGYSADEATQLAVFLSDQRAAHRVATRFAVHLDRDSAGRRDELVAP